MAPVVTLALACTRVTEPLPEIGATVITPLPQYALWWSLAETCSGLKRDFSEIRWLSDPSSAVRTQAGSADTVVGEWFDATSSIVLARDYLANAAVVRHEMLHALLRSSGHPAVPFRDGCAGYVVCDGACARSVGALTGAGAGAPRLPVDSLIVTQRLFPERISFVRDKEGWFALVVEVSNPKPYPVWARLRAFPGRPNVSATFGYATAAGSQQSEVTGDSMSFAARETKRMVFDLSARQYLAAYGSPTIRGFFNATQLPERRLEIEN